MGAEELPHDADVLGLVDPDQHDREVPRDPVRPQLGRAARMAREHIGRRSQRAVRVQDAAGEVLEEMGLVHADAEMVDLHLRLGPGERGGPVEGRRISILVGEGERLVARWRDQRREHDAHGATRRQPHPTSKTDDRVENGADGVGERAGLEHGQRRADPPPPPHEFRAVGFPLRGTDDVAFHTHDVGQPQSGLVGRPRAASGEQGVQRGDGLRVNEQVRKRRVREIRGGRGEHDLGVRRELDLPGLRPEVREGHAADLRVVFGGDDHLEGGRDAAIAAHDLRPVLREGHVVALRLATARLVARRPRVPALGVAKEDVRATDITRSVFPPAGDGQIAPAAVSGAGGGHHHRVAPVR